jgi:hypothetical protein
LEKTSYAGAKDRGFVPAIGRKKKHRRAEYLIWIMLFVKKR